MLRRLIIALVASAALAMTVPAGAVAAGRGGHGSGGHGFASRAGHFAGPGRFGGGGFYPGYGGYYAPDYGYYYPPDYGYYYEPDYGAAVALGIISTITGIMSSHMRYHHHCLLHHGLRYCR